MNGAHNAGVYVGPYHFARPDSKDGVKFTSYDGNPFPVGSAPYLDATSEAADFVQSIRPFYNSGSYLPPVADMETWPTGLPTIALQKTFVSNWLQLFSDTVKSAIGVRPIVYTSTSAANTYFTPTVAAEHQLWEAVWKGTGTTSPPTTSNTPNWPAWQFWQWSDGADSIAQADQVPGTSVSVDRDVYVGSARTLSSLLIHNVPGDYNHNGVVDAADYVVWRSSLGSTVNLAADGNNDEVVNQADYTFWRSHLGATAGSGAELGSGSAVPEPASTLLLACGALVAIGCRPIRRR
jgi:GH25 family lysozyme M1 (1,4-beta-N-acetylmuramidase)